MARSRNAATMERPTHEVVRAWARKQPQFKDIGDRGRISSAVRQAYNEAHPDNPYMSGSTGTTPFIKNDTMVEAAELAVRSVSIVQELMELADEMDDPNRDFYHPDVSRRMRAIVEDVMSR